MIEFISWRVRLWLVDYRWRVKSREQLLTYRYMWYGWPWRWLRDFVDRASTFDQWEGYSSVRFRRWLWKLSHPLITMRLASLRWVIAILNRISPYVGPGRFEGLEPSTALKVEWLDSNTEWADGYSGDLSISPLVGHLFTEAAVPWSRQPEHWFITCDTQGFRYGHQFGSAEAARVEFASFEEAFGVIEETDDQLAEQERDDLYESQIRRFGR